MSDMYRQTMQPGQGVAVVETEIDLYHEIALEMYRRVAAAAREERDAVFIVPVGPTFQYRRFVRLCRLMPIDLSRVAPVFHG